MIYKLNRPWRVSKKQPGVIMDSKGFPVCSVSVLPVKIHDLNSVAEFIVLLVNASIIIEKDKKMDQRNLTDVSEAIIQERLYQDQKFGTVGQHPHELPSWIYIMGNALDKANYFWISGIEDLAIKEILQATAVGFACLQQYGIPERAKRVKNE